MHSDSSLRLVERLNAIATFTASFDRDRDVLIAEIKAALQLMGFDDFAVLTVNNFHIVQRSASSFTSGDKLFGKQLSTLMAPELLSRCNFASPPVIVSGQQLLLGPMALMQNNCAKHVAVFSLFRTRFIYGYVVVYGDDQAALESMLWPLNALAMAAVDAVTNLRPETPANCVLKDEEIAVLKWTKKNMTAQQVADTLNISLRRVNHCLHRAMAKLGAHNKGAAADMAKEMGLF